MVDDDRPHTPILFPDHQQRSAPQETIENKEQAIDWLNKSYALISINGKVKVLREKDDGDIEIMDKKDFMLLHQNKRITITSPDDGKSKIAPITELWFNGSHREYDNGFVFNPSRVGHYNRMYNLFRGYKIVPRPGDCTIFLDYIKSIICSNNQRDYDFLVALISQMFQYPHLKPGIAVVLRGDEGVGKSFFIEKLCALMSPYYFKTSNPAYVFGDHNAQLKNVIVLHLEEAVWAGSKKDESLLKDLITGPEIPINDKFVPVYSVPNHLHLFISGNPEWLVSAGFKARRLFALHVSDAQRTITDYFSGIDKWFTSGGAASLMHYFMNYKTDINLRLVPVTDELIFQKKQGLSGVAEWVMNIAETGVMPFGELVDGGGCNTIKGLLYYDFCKSPMGRNTRMSERQFGESFLKLFPLVDDDIVQKYPNGKTISVIKSDLKIKGMRGIRFNAYGLPPLAVWRSCMDFDLGGNTDWDAQTEWTVVRPNDDEIGDIYDKGKKF